MTVPRVAWKWVAIGVIGVGARLLQSALSGRPVGFW
jgi:hypothetical protein